MEKSQLVKNLKDLGWNCIIFNEKYALFRKQHETYRWYLHQVEINFVTKKCKFCMINPKSQYFKDSTDHPQIKQLIENYFKEVKND